LAFKANEWNVECERRKEERGTSEHGGDNVTYAKRQTSLFPADKKSGLADAFLRFDESS